ncbi:sulfatase [Actinomadura rugatobispora]|uniref:Sulfatase n=1 Tax=Actinomadura rugatobispora TaxID=1994 RepID=A0ABW0ZSV0_9ACTN|nr:hypothetical protein GCM10010200_110080 [Actinomadura rugatobispora]
MRKELTADSPLDHVPDENVDGPVPSPGETPADDAAADDVVPGRRLAGARRAAGWAATALAGLLVLGALLFPHKVGRLTPGAFARVPVEGVLLVALVVIVPARARRTVAVLAGAAIGVMTIVKVVDMGFYQVLARPFDPVLDWVLIGSGVEFLDSSFGRAGAIAAVIGIVLLAAALLVLMALSVLRLARLVVRYNATATATVGVAGTVWIVCAALGAQVVPGVPVAARNTAGLTLAHTRQVHASLLDRRAFAEQAAVDAFRGTAGADLLRGLRGKDVLLAFVESYGRDAVEDPLFARQVGAVLDDGTRRLRAAGVGARSGWLTSPTAGGSSWLAHSTLLSGLWIDNQQRYRSLVSSDRLTLNQAFRRASWRSVAVVPGVTRAWPEGDFFGYDRVYDANNLGYRGPRFSFATMPDQYTLAAFERLEREKPDHAPVLAEIPLVSSHAPWAPLPRLIDWKDVGDGSVYHPIAAAGERRAAVWRDPARIRTEYRRSIEYTLGTLVSYVETHGDDDLVLVFVGDHQPLPVVTGEGAGRDVPITIVARDKAVLDRISGWGWQDGLKPGPNVPVWPMHAFRDRFLTAFSR